MITLEACTIPGSLDSWRKDWCMYEHYTHGTDGQPPERIYVGACLLREVLHAPDAKRNTHWNAIVKPDTPLLVRILHTGTISECLNARAMHCRGANMPICNAIGRDISTTQRLIKCSNGATYRTQQDAAIALGLNQSSISKVLRKLPGFKSVGGYTFEYGETDV